MSISQGLPPKKNPVYGRQIFEVSPDGGRDSPESGTLYAKGWLPDGVSYRINAEFTSAGETMPIKQGLICQSIGVLYSLQCHDSRRQQYESGDWRNSIEG